VEGNSDNLGFAQLYLTTFVVDLTLCVTAKNSECFENIAEDEVQFAMMIPL